MKGGIAELREGAGKDKVEAKGLRNKTSYSCFAAACAASAVCDFRGGSRGLSTTREGTARARERARRRTGEDAGSGG